MLNKYMYTGSKLLGHMAFILLKRKLQHMQGNIQFSCFVIFSLDFLPKDLQPLKREKKQQKQTNLT